MQGELKSVVRERLVSLEEQGSVYNRAALEAELPDLIRFGTALWTSAFSGLHTRVNSHLLRNAPELWLRMTPQDWVEVMRSVEDRSYAAGDVIATGRFDDIKFLCYFFGVDAIRWYFEVVPPSTSERCLARQWVKRHVGACTFMYLPMSDPEGELDGVHVTFDQLQQYGEDLRAGACLRPASSDSDAIRTYLDGLRD